jgi:hypothetical protein
MNPMKGLRKAALGLAVVACLLTAVPVAQAGVMDTPVLTDAGGWFAGWLERIARWMSWIDQPGPGEGDAGQVRPVFEQDNCGLDPNGAPRPCTSGTRPEPFEDTRRPLRG